MAAVRVTSRTQQVTHVHAGQTLERQKKGITTVQGKICFSDCRNQKEILNQEERKEIAGFKAKRYFFKTIFVGFAVRGLLLEDKVESQTSTFFFFFNAATMVRYISLMSRISKHFRVLGLS